MLAERMRDDLISRSTNPRKRNNVERLWKALEHMRVIGSRDYSLANVGRTVMALQLKGPAEQTLRNNKELRALVLAYAADYGAKKRKGNPEDDLLTSIPDLNARAAVRLLQADNASWRRKNDILHNLIRQLHLSNGAVANAIEPPVQGLAPALQARGATNFSSIEIQSVRRFTDTMEDEHGWRIDEASGAVMWETNGMNVAGPGFYHALRKVADLT